MSNKNLKLAIGIATRGDDLVPSLVDFLSTSIIKYNAEFIWKACGWSAQIPQEAVYQEAAISDIDYLLMVDSDVTPPNNCIDIMLSRNVDVISAPIWHYDPNPLTGGIHLNITKSYGVREMNTNSEGIEEIISSSFGCLLLSHAVLRKFISVGESFTTWSPLIEPIFKTHSSDVILFRKISKFGFKIYVDWDVRGCEHYTKVHLSDRVLGKFVRSLK